VTPTGEFEFRREWSTPAPLSRVHDALADVQSYPVWWPQVRAVARIDDDTARVLCRSDLPYTLDLVLHAVRREPALLEVSISGDLEGWSRAELAPEGARSTRVTYTQRVVVGHRGLALASTLMRPVLRWNHERMMAGLEQGLAQVSGGSGPGPGRAR
jgi:carbon monoxide dehydrogenase subunit G